MKVKTAAQVLSRSVAAALEMYSQFNGISTSETAEFLMTFNDIFDAMNSSQLRDANKRKSAITNTSDHVAFLKSTLDWIAEIHAVDANSNKDVPYIIA